jgi:hypothetical protein
MRIGGAGRHSQVKRSRGARLIKIPHDRGICDDKFWVYSCWTQRFNLTDKTVLIFGLGITGPTLAYWLNAAGFKTTLIERASKLRTEGYVIDFWGLRYDIAKRMGLLDEIKRAGYHIRECGS